MREKDADEEKDEDEDLEERLAREELGEDAADGPEVDGLGVLLPGEDDLGGTIPAGGDVLGHEGDLRKMIRGVQEGE